MEAYVQKLLQVRLVVADPCGGRTLPVYLAAGGRALTLCRCGVQILADADTDESKKFIEEIKSA